MNQTTSRRVRFVSPQGLITIALVLVAAFCAADQAFNARDYIRPSWLVVLALSFPVGWLVGWLAHIITPMFPGTVQLGVLYVIAAMGTVLNIHLFVSAIFWYFRNRSVQRPPEEREAEFQKLLAEHRKRSS